MNLNDQLSHLDRVLLSTIRTEFPEPLSDEEKAMSNAYLVLCHAVLEEYLESTFQDHCSRLSKWPLNANVPVEVARFALALSTWVPKMPAYKSRKIEGVFKQAYAQLEGHIKANHGIRTSNIQKLASYVGLDWSSLENALNTELNDLDALGSKRGEAGHLSPYSEQAVMITHMVYPDDMRAWVRAGRDAAAAIAAYLDQLVSQPGIPPTPA